MRTAYAWLLKSFLTAFLLLIATQILILTIGISTVLKIYSSNQINYLEELARQILINPASVPIERPEHSGPFFVFSADKNLLYSNRGKGRSIPSTDFRPVLYESRTIGYYYAGEVRFLDSQANRIFLTSLGVLLAGSMLVSFGLAILAAIRATRSIAGPVQLLRHDIGELRNLKEVGLRDFSIVELGDISESLHEVSRLLAGEEEHKRQWMHNIAHDLRTPISGLRGQLEGMRDGVLPVSRERFEQNLKEIGRLEELATGITELYNLETLTSIPTENIGVAEFCSELRLPFEHLLEQKHIELHCRVELDNLRGNRTLLLRALRNILSNSVGYCSAGAQIDLSFSIGPRGKSLIRIANTGPRIPDDQLERIFQRFYRGEYSRTTPGSGLGLNITREIIHLHGGTIAAGNLDPTGVEFNITLGTL